MGTKIWHGEVLLLRLEMRSTRCPAATPAEQACCKVLGLKTKASDNLRLIQIVRLNLQTRDRPIVNPLGSPRPLTFFTLQLSRPTAMVPDPLRPLINLAHGDAGVAANMPCVCQCRMQRASCNC